MESHMNRIGKFGMFIAAAALFAGCQDNKNQSAHRDMRKMEQPRHMDEPALSVDRLIESQAAMGAKSDATLYPQHFDGGELNALGRSKLALIMRANAQSPRTVVYMDLGRPNDMTTPRRGSVERFWRDSMSGQTQLEIRDGMNTGMTYSAAKSLERLPLTNNPGEKAGGAQTTPGEGTTPERNPGMTGGTQDTLFK
jgi:hypothetical protein